MHFLEGSQNIWILEDNMNIFTDRCYSNFCFTGELVYIHCMDNLFDIVS